MVRQTTSKFPVAGEQLRRVGNGGWNHVPLPAWGNRGHLNRRVAGIPVYRIGTTGVVGYAAYRTIDYAYDNVSELVGPLAEWYDE